MLTQQQYLFTRQKSLAHGERPLHYRGGMSFTSRSRCCHHSLGAGQTDLHVQNIFLTVLSCAAAVVDMSAEHVRLLWCGLPSSSAGLGAAVGTVKLRAHVADCSLPCSRAFQTCADRAFYTLESRSRTAIVSSLISIRCRASTVLGRAFEQPPG